MNHVASKMAFMGGFVTGLFEAIHVEDVGKTIVLTIIGATTSYIITKGLAALHKKLFK